MGLSAESFLPLLARPDTPAEGADRAPTGRRRFTVVAANVARSTRDTRAQAEALVALDADAVLVVEATDTTVDALDGAGLARRWPHAAAWPDEGFFGALVASRHPVIRAESRSLGGRPGLVVDLAVGRMPVRVVPVHTQAPIFDRDVGPWHDTLAATAAVAGEVAGPVVLAGDWNATGGHRAFRRNLRAHALVDAQAVLGQRWLPTWPVRDPRRSRLPPLLALDHVVTSADVRVAALERLPLPGTDHLALRATLHLPHP
ncbi:MAG TPA: endonuclease/exonuclease/phosphatase family protein [Acidimicrobiales bacterium]|nr:endonuclease/exonuclease/phosphatase family protein [Acidimicrobiales bacterium]